jgi:hypothetical protein
VQLVQEKEIRVCMLVGGDGGWGQKEETYRVITLSIVIWICLKVEAGTSAHGIGSRAGGYGGCDGYGLQAV